MYFRPLCRRAYDGERRQRQLAASLSLFGHLAFSSACSSRIYASVGYLLTTQFFFVPSHLVYKLCFAGGCSTGVSAHYRFLAVAGMISLFWPVPSTSPIDHDINSHVCDPPPTCRAQEYLPARGQRSCRFQWPQLVASAKSFMLSCMPLARMCSDHALACLSRHFRTAHLYCARAASSEPVTIGGRP